MGGIAVWWAWYIAKEIILVPAYMHLLLAKEGNLKLPKYKSSINLFLFLSRHTHIYIYIWY